MRLKEKEEEYYDNRNREDDKKEVRKMNDDCNVGLPLKKPDKSKEYIPLPNYKEPKIDLGRC